MVFNFMDSFNIVEYIANGFAESRITNKLDYHFRANLSTAINHTKVSLKMNSRKLTR